MSREEPEASLTRPALVMVLGGVSVGLSLGNWVERDSAIAQALLSCGCFLIAGAVLTTLWRLYQHWRDSGR
jgi:hypothetical protein